MSKYAPLRDFLRVQPLGEVAMSFDEIEAVIGAALPPRAQLQRAWWSNNPANNVMTRAWLDAGFRTERVDLKRRRLTFRRSEAAPRPATVSGAWRASRERPAVAGQRHPAFGALEGSITIAPGIDLTEPADPEWADLAARKIPT